MKKNKFWLFLSLIPLLTSVGCRPKPITHTKEELTEIVSKYDKSVTYSNVEFKIEGHLFEALLPEDKESYNAGLSKKAEEKYPYNDKLTGAAAEKDKEWNDKERKKFIEQNSIKFDMETTSPLKLLSPFFRVPFQLYEGDTPETKYFSTESFSVGEKEIEGQYTFLEGKLIERYSINHKVYDVMETEIKEDGSIRFYSNYNYKTVKIRNFNNYTEITARGRFYISYGYDKNGFLEEILFKTSKTDGDMRQRADLKINYTYE